MGFARNPGNQAPDSKHSLVQLDLLDRPSVENALSGIALKSFHQVIWVHSVGKFAFEANGLPATDLDHDGIDDDVFHANVTTSMHFLRGLISEMKNQGSHASLHFCLFGSTSSDYPTPFWPSFTKSKQLLSTLAQMEISRHPPIEIHGIMAKLSTVRASKLSCHRKLEDAIHFLSAEEVVEKTMPHLLQPRTHWRELNIFKPHPDFDPTWYWDPQKIKERWALSRKSTGSAANP